MSSSEPETGDFDVQAAWLRRFRADAEGNLRAFALRLRAAMPDAVTVHEKRGLFARSGTVTGLTVEIDTNRYTLALEGARLRASIATVVRGIAISTRQIEPAEWFARLGAETRRATAQAQALSQSLAEFMAG